jgi:hypothetical protein
MRPGVAAPKRNPVPGYDVVRTSDTPGPGTVPGFWVCVYDRKAGDPHVAASHVPAFLDFRISAEGSLVQNRVLYRKSLMYIFYIGNP